MVICYRFTAVAGVINWEWQASLSIFIVDIVLFIVLWYIEIEQALVSGKQIQLNE